MKALLILVALAGTAHAGVCDDKLSDPLPLGVRAGGFDATRAACLRTDMDARIGAHALIDTPGFYGTLGGGLSLGVRFLEKFGLEWGVTFDVVDVTFAQTAVLTATEATYGPFAAHAAMGHDLDDRTRIAAFVRAELPFTRSQMDESAAGAQLAALLTHRPIPRLTMHGRLGLLGWYGSSSGGTTTRGAVVGSIDGAVRTWRWLDAFAGVELQGGWYGFGLDHVAARAGAQLRIHGAWRLDTGVMLPLHGAERTNLVFTLGVLRDR